MNTPSLSTFAGGCFWCTEAIFQKLKGVNTVIPGYTGGSLPNPTYDQVCSGTTGHAEAIQLEYDEKIISYPTLLTVFFHTHDPTTLNRQGADSGTQYRSAIFYHTAEQKIQAEEVTKQREKEINRHIVTTIIPASLFYPAESYHQNYFAKNSYAPYCQVVIDPKIQKLYKDYAPLLKNPVI